MREIKFRAWDGEQMREIWSLHYPSKNVNVATYDHNGSEMLKGDYLKNVPVMQYTGLLDKNGVEIYEGDIIDDHHGTIYPMQWNYRLLATVLESSVEVIGNIYENPELIKEGQK